LVGCSWLCLPARACTCVLCVSVCACVPTVFLHFRVLCVCVRACVRACVFCVLVRVLCCAVCVLYCARALVSARAHKPALPPKEASSNLEVDSSGEPTTAPRSPAKIACIAPMPAAAAAAGPEETGADGRDAGLHRPCAGRAPSGLCHAAGCDARLL
jgi:hypothetical protein